MANGIIRSNQTKIKQSRTSGYFGTAPNKDFCKDKKSSKIVLLLQEIGYEKKKESFMYLNNLSSIGVDWSNQNFVKIAQGLLKKGEINHKKELADFIVNLNNLNHPKGLKWLEQYLELVDAGHVEIPENEIIEQMNDNKDFLTHPQGTKFILHLVKNKEASTGNYLKLILDMFKHGASWEDPSFVELAYLALENLVIRKNFYVIAFTEITFNNPDGLKWINFSLDKFFKSESLLLLSGLKKYTDFFLESEEHLKILGRILKHEQGDQQDIIEYFFPKILEKGFKWTENELVSDIAEYAFRKNLLTSSTVSIISSFEDTYSSAKGREWSEMVMKASIIQTNTEMDKNFVVSCENNMSLFIQKHVLRIFTKHFENNNFAGKRVSQLIIDSIEEYDMWELQEFRKLIKVMVDKGRIEKQFLKTIITHPKTLESDEALLMMQKYPIKFFKQNMILFFDFANESDDFIESPKVLNLAKELVPKDKDRHLDDFLGVWANLLTKQNISWDTPGVYELGMAILLNGENLKEIRSSVIEHIELDMDRKWRENLNSITITNLTSIIFNKKTFTTQFGLNWLQAFLDLYKTQSGWVEIEGLKEKLFAMVKYNNDPDIVAKKEELIEILEEGFKKTQAEANSEL